MQILKATVIETGEEIEVKCEGAAAAEVREVATDKIYKMAEIEIGKTLKTIAPPDPAKKSKSVKV